jgi:hypothetical protein
MEFHSKIVGSTFCNSQDIIRGLKTGDVLELVQEKENLYDSHAVRIEKEGIKLGYLPKDTAYGVSDNIESGEVYTATVSEVTGRDKDNVGCNLLIIVGEE